LRIEKRSVGYGASKNRVIARDLVIGSSEHQTQSLDVIKRFLIVMGLSSNEVHDVSQNVSLAEC